MGKRKKTRGLKMVDGERRLQWLRNKGVPYETAINQVAQRFKITPEQADSAAREVYARPRPGQVVQGGLCSRK